MRRLTAVLAALCAACTLVLLGCGGATTGTVVFEETVSPNEQYVSSEADVVYYTVRVTQAAPGTATVSAESNSGFFEPVSYEIACDGELSADDVSVKWTTLMGGTEPSEDDQIAVAEVSVRAGDGSSYERKISFVTRALEMAAEATPGAWAHDEKSLGTLGKS